MGVSRRFLSPAKSPLITPISDITSALELVGRFPTNRGQLGLVGCNPIGGASANLCCQATQRRRQTRVTHMSAGRRNRHRPASGTSIECAATASRLAFHSARRGSFYHLQFALVAAPRCPCSPSAQRPSNLAPRLKTGRAPKRTVAKLTRLASLWTSQPWRSTGLVANGREAVLTA